MKSQTDRNQETLRDFANQLHIWGQERLRRVPGPFRQAELCSDLIAERSPFSSPLVFWVNRESLQAGSVILLPRKAESAIFAPATATARALGLPFFFLWGRTDLSCWSVAGEQPERTWQLVLPDEAISSSAGFRKMSNALIDQAEQTYYSYQPDIPTITGAYLANLIHLTLHDLSPEIRKKTAADVSDISGTGVESLLLHRLLLPIALAVEGKLPHRVRTEVLDDELFAAAAKLSPGLRAIFTERPVHIDITQGCQRRLSLYINRVNQIIGHLRDSSSDAVSLLLSRWARTLRGAPFAFVPTGLQLAVINPDRCLTEPSPSLEIGSPGILAATALIRHLSGTEPDTATDQRLDCLDLTKTLPEHHIVGTLHDERIPAAAERKRLNALLRFSWPNHKLALAGKAPIWTWHFLHLCGLLAGESRLELQIPKNWLWEKYGQTILSSLIGKLVFTTIREVDAKLMQVTLVPGEKPVETVLERRDGRKRSLRHEAFDFLRSHALLALSLPDPLYRLLETGELEFRSPEEYAGVPLKGLQNYCHSSLGRGLWKLLAPGRPLPKHENLPNKMAEYCIPLPDDKVLSSLARLKTSDPISASDAADQELASWFGPLPQPQLPPRQSGRRSGTPLSAEEQEGFLQRCRAEEIPIFPDNYLYDVPSSERLAYRIAGPLEIVDVFFDETILQGASETLTVRGTEQADALVMVSLVRSGAVELPRSESITREILDRYRRDLKKLRRAFFAHATAFSAPGEATVLVELAWQDRGMPDWNLVNNR